MGKFLSRQQHGRRIIPHDLKYPMFFLGLLIMIGGGVGAQRLNLPLNVEVAIVAIGFVILFLGIVLE